MTLTYKNAKTMRATQNRDRKRYQNTGQKAFQKVTRTGDVSQEIYPVAALMLPFSF